jgi:hypothetical protein
VLSSRAASAPGAGVTVDELLKELTRRRAGVKYSAMGMAAIISALRAHEAAGRGGAFVDAVNSGETTVDGRPLLHVEDKAGGNSLPRAIGRAFNQIRAESVSRCSVRLAWTSDGAGLTVAQATVARSINEALLGIFLHTQQTQADDARETSAAAQGSASAGASASSSSSSSATNAPVLRCQQNCVTIGLNFISCGRSVGDPRRAAATMQAGAQGNTTLAALRADPSNIVAVEFLVDRLHRQSGIGRGVVLALLANDAYSQYCSYVGKLGDLYELEAESEDDREDFINYLVSLDLGFVFEEKNDDLPRLIMFGRRSLGALEDELRDAIALYPAISTGSRSRRTC